MLTCSSKVDNKTNAQLILSHSIQEHIRSCFSFAPFALKLTLFKLKCILANSRRTKLFTSIERQKLHGDKNDFVYNRLIKDVCNYMNCKKQNINFIKQVLMTTICI